MPRRHQIPNPDQPKRSTQTTPPRSSAHTSPTQSTAQSAVTTKSSTNARSNTQSPDRSVAPAPHPAVQSFTSRMYSLKLPKQPNPFTNDAELANHFECMSKQISADLHSRPLTISGDLNIEGISLKQNSDNTTSVEMLTNRPLTKKEARTELSDSFRTQLMGRLNEPLRQEFQAARKLFDDHSFAILMKTEYTTQGPSLPLKWNHQPQSCEMTAVIRSLVCLIDRQEKWQAFLSELNKSLTYVLPTYPVFDSAGQKATQVIMSNHERKLLITMKFGQPCSPPDQSWTRSSSNNFYLLLTFARHDQLSRNPNDTSNNRSLNEISTYMMGQIGKDNW